MIDQGPDHQGRTENTQIQQEKQGSLLCQTDLQARAHSGQAKHGPQDGENDPEDKDSRAGAEKQ